MIVADLSGKEVHTDVKIDSAEAVQFTVGTGHKCPYRFLVRSSRVTCPQETINNNLRI